MTKPVRRKDRFTLGLLGYALVLMLIWRFIFPRD